MGAFVLVARWMLPSPERLVEGGGLLVEGARVRAVLASRAAVRRALAGGARARELGEVLLTPGTVNAHAHLELGGLHGRLPRDEAFAAWIGELLAERAALGRADFERAVVRGADRLLATGTTAVGDVDSTGAAGLRLGAHPIRARVYREVLDARDPARSAAALRRVRRGLPPRRGRLEGLSPHAPYSVSPELFRRAAELARRRGLPCAVHWAETEEERRWLLAGDGPFARILRDPPRQSGLDAIEVAGLLGPGLALVHGNHPERGDYERIARAGSTLVHCPGTHTFFGREPFDVGRALRAGVSLALGTDSLASNEELDMRRETSLLRRSAPGLRPATVWGIATRGGARALGLEGQIGVLAPGALADVCAWVAAPASAEAACDRLTSGEPRLAAAWVGGRRARRPQRTRRSD